MDKATKRNRIKLYFMGASTKTQIQLIVWGIVLFLIGLMASEYLGFLILLGILLAGAGGGWLYYILSKAITDAEVDQWIREDLSSFASESLNKMGIDMDELVGEPLVVIGPRLWDYEGRTYVKKGKDGVLRFSPVEAMVLNQTQNQLAIYQCVFDLTTGHLSHVDTDEYFYKDIVSISTKTESKTVRLKIGDNVEAKPFEMKETEKFSLTTSGGTRVEVTVRDPKLESMFKGTIPTTSIERAISTVRKMLREKKGNS